MDPGDAGGVFVEAADDDGGAEVRRVAGEVGG